MRRIYFIAAGLLALSASISLWLWANGFPPEWSTDKGETVSGVRAFLTAPLRIVAVGTVLTILMAWVKRSLLPEAGKVRAIVAMGVLAMPVLTLFLQVIMPLMLYDVIGEVEADYALAGLVILFFLIMGNYVVTAPFEARVGFRNKWTLSDPIIWTRTHRFLGRSLVTGALLTIPLLAVIHTDYVIYTPIIIAIFLKATAYLYARSLGQRLALRDASRL